MIVSLELYVAFVVASAALVLTPGPMVAYIIATTLGHGVRHGFLALIGSAAASLVQLVVVVAGLSLILNLAGEAFIWIKWAGVAYLVFLGVRALTTPPGDLKAPKTLRTDRRTIVEAFFVNLTNPKALLFHGAFLPLFVSPAGPAIPQLAMLAVTFIIVAAALDGCWVMFAAHAQKFLKKVGRWRNRITGAILLTAAAGLTLVRR